MDQRNESKRAKKVNIWIVILIFGGTWAFALLGAWSALLLVEAWKAIKANLLVAYGIVSRTDNVLCMGALALCCALSYAIFGWIIASMKERGPKKAKVKTKPAKAKNHQKRTKKKSLDGELYIEPREDAQMPENGEINGFAPENGEQPVGVMMEESQPASEAVQEGISNVTRTRRRPRRPEESEEHSAEAEQSAEGE